MGAPAAPKCTQVAESVNSGSSKELEPPHAANPVDGSNMSGKKCLRPRAANGLAITPAAACPPSETIQNATTRAEETDENNARIAEQDTSTQSLVPECSERGFDDGETDMELDDGELIAIDGIPDRILSATDQEEQLRTLRSNWDFAVVLDFFEVFEKQLKLKTFFTINQLEEALLLSQGTAPSLLCDLHMELLNGVCPSTTITEENWQCVLARRVYTAFYFTPHLNPFGRVQLASAPGLYAGLTAQDRAMLLRTLCELRCDKDDLRNVIDLAQKSEAQQMKILAQKNERGHRKRKIVMEEDTYDVDDFNRGAWGEDAKERQYWLYDLGSQGGIRMCRETLPCASDLLLDAPAAKGKGKKQCLGGASVKSDVDAGAWETIATGTEGIVAVGEKLMKSKQREDVRLGTDLVEDLAKELRERALADERRSKALERQRRQLEMLVNAGRDRQMRERKQVNYTYEHVYHDVDRELKRSTREKRYGSKPLSDLPPGQPSGRPPYVPPPGAPPPRRGRSAGPIAHPTHEDAIADAVVGDAAAEGAASADRATGCDGEDVQISDTDANEHDSDARPQPANGQHKRPDGGMAACEGSRTVQEQGQGEGVGGEPDSMPEDETSPADGSVHIASGVPDDNGPLRDHEPSAGIIKLACARNNTNTAATTATAGCKHDNDFAVMTTMNGTQTCL